MVARWFSVVTSCSPKVVGSIPMGFGLSFAFYFLVVWMVGGDKGRGSSIWNFGWSGDMENLLLCDFGC
jgi:hypothetical protein